MSSSIQSYSESGSIKDAFTSYRSDDSSVSLDNSSSSKASSSRSCSPKLEPESPVERKYPENFFGRSVRPRSPANDTYSSLNFYPSRSYLGNPEKALTGRRFFHVGGKDLDKLDVLTEIFNRILTPLYGSQDKAIAQIKEGADRTCFLMYEDSQPVGVLAFKTRLSDEFKDLGLVSSIEIKSLFVDNAAQNSGKGLGSALIDKLNEEVSQLKCNPAGIHVTVSETKAESLLFFQKKGFKVVHQWKDRYIEGVTEYLLYCSLEKPKDLGVEEEKEFITDRSSSQLDVPELVHIIHNAHLDDIHALKKLSDGTFISGSKDHSMYKWSPEGKLVKVVAEVEPTHQNDRNWITALTILNDCYFVSGERNGKVFLWRTDGSFVKEIKLKLPALNDHVSRSENLRRVNCLSSGMSSFKPSFFVGFPTMFDEYNLIEGRTESSVMVHKNDWVYSILPISDTAIVSITGCTVDIWSKDLIGSWKKTKNLLPEGKTVYVNNGNRRIKQRPFLSSISRLDQNTITLSCFDGTVKVLDVINGTVTFDASEHTGRVWTTEPISRTTFASSGDDGSVRIWDVRENMKSIHTITGYRGPVTSLLSFDQNTLIAGSCSEKSGNQKTGAEILFYDLRKFGSSKK